MHRRDFLGAIAATVTVGTAAGVNAATFAGGGGARRLGASRGSAGISPFALTRIALLPELIVAAATASGKGLVLSPARNVDFYGLVTPKAALNGQRLMIDAVHRTDSGAEARHGLWAHGPKQTSHGSIFRALDAGFAAFDVAHTSVDGVRSEARFNFAASGSGPFLLPGVYVLAGPRSGTSLPPDLSNYAFSGNRRAPIIESSMQALDFSYLTFTVRGEWL